MRAFAAFLELLFPPRPHERAVRAGGLALHAHGTGSSFTLDDVEVTALLPYRDPTVRSHIIEAKFHGNEQARDALAFVLSEYLGEFLSDERAFYPITTLVPIPLGKKRVRTRGDNQVIEICRRALRNLGEEKALAERTLVRIRETLPQTELSGDARRTNMHGAFEGSGTLDPAHSYVVVDDVVTTGATLIEAIRALRERGARRIVAIALAG